MRKSVCPACGLVNLDSFPSFPQCEGCGARLPRSKRRPWFRAAKRPGKTLVWAFSVGAGVASLALLSVGIARETRLRDRGALLVSSALLPDPQGGRGVFVLSLQVATSDRSDREPISNLRLRVSQKNALDSNAQILSPSPFVVQNLGGGRYFVWHEFVPRSTIRLRLRPREALKLELVADGFTRFDLNLRPTRASLYGRINRSN